MLLRIHFYGGQADNKNFLVKTVCFTLFSDVKCRLFRANHHLLHNPYKKDFFAENDRIFLLTKVYNSGAKKSALSFKKILGGKRCEFT